MPYFDLTSTAQILAVLTVDDTDIDAEKIEAQGLDDDLGAQLDKALPGVWEGIADGTGTGASTSRLRKLKLVAKYFCAGTVARMAQVFILKKDTDGSNEGQRSDKDGWLWMSDRLMETANDHLRDLLKDLDLVPATAMPYTMFARVIPERDPITEPRAAATE
ncbi:hypothetical protein HOV23_gp007 [Pseudomonas phage Lana]|uniref:Uncharacterized protein n=1 Tax=Pseudomonas phage Lana TaxID=2530172 RepID=A0A481W6Q1_9CAUD|nr:hypothetical protein HOV23_gp007 [Pseudomonas phage Lana]QBJ04567.1 hypothetical protein [Pseudomonas phage Lana]